MDRQDALEVGSGFLVFTSAVACLAIMGTSSSAPATSTPSDGPRDYAFALDETSGRFG